jgi:hypothetical protein
MGIQTFSHSCPLLFSAGWQPIFASKSEKFVNVSVQAVSLSRTWSWLIDISY